MCFGSKPKYNPDNYPNMAYSRPANNYTSKEYKRYQKAARKNKSSKPVKSHGGGLGNMLGDGIANNYSGGGHHGHHGHSDGGGSSGWGFFGGGDGGGSGGGGGDSGGGGGGGV